MNHDEYQKLYADALSLDKDFETIVLPVEVQNGESPDEAFMRFLVNEGLIETQGEDKWRIPDRDRINNYNPSLLKFLDAIVMASVHAEMDELIEEGFAYMTADDEGNIVYELTEEGKRHKND
jgi:hypothetical protein